jgi:hypothetical protein
MVGLDSNPYKASDLYFLHERGSMVSLYAWVSSHFPVEGFYVDTSANTASCKAPDPPLGQCLEASWSTPRTIGAGQCG